MSPDSVNPEVERETKGEAEYVEGGSVAMRSGTVQHSRLHPMFDTGFVPEETNYLADKRMSETVGLPERQSKDTNKLYKKAKQNSSELAEPRRSPTACFGLKRKQEIESYATQVADSQPESEDCGTHVPQETRRKSNPFVEDVKLRRHMRKHPKASCLLIERVAWGYPNHCRSTDLWH